MPISADDILNTEPVKRNGHSPAGSPTGTFIAGGDSLWDTPVGEGNRNNALIKIVGHLRAKGMPFEGVFGAQRLIRTWNQECVNPPLDDRELETTLSRAWARWDGGTIPDLVPAGFNSAVPAGFGESAAKAEPEEEPILSVSDLYGIAEDPEQQLKWIADELIAEQGINTVSAAPGAGKTWLVVDLCRHLTREQGEVMEPWLGKYNLPPMGVFYLDGENGKKTISSRIHKLGFFRGCSRFFAWCHSNKRLDKDADRARIIQICKEKDLRVLVLDSLIAFHSCKENDANEMRKVGDWLKEFTQAGLTVIALHHDRKGNGFEGAGQDLTRGSGDITAFSHCVLGLQQKVVDKVTTYTITKRKVRDADNDQETITYALMPDPDRPGGVKLDVEAGTNIKQAHAAEKAENANTEKKGRFMTAINTLVANCTEPTLTTVCVEAKMSKPTAMIVRDSLIESGDITIEKISGLGGQRDVFKISVPF